MIPSLLVTLNVAKLTPGKIPLGRNNQHKIKLTTAQIAPRKGGLGANSDEKFHDS